jgi:hypothetical protein
MDKSQILTALEKGAVEVQGQFVAGSNYTFFALVQHEGLALKAVYKPVRGEQPLWDFPPNTLARREAAAFVLSEILGWELVPPTVFRRKAPVGAGSLQYFIEHDPEKHYFNFDHETRQRLQPAALFDVLANNADRKGGHILVDEQNHLWLIDHGVCFHIEDKLRTVIWDFASLPIPENLLGDLARLAGALDIPDGPRQELAGLLSPGEIKALLSRARRLLESGCFPQPLPSRRSYPWPPI